MDCLRVSLLAVVVLAGSLGCGGGPSIRVDRQVTYYLQHNLRAHGRTVTSINDWHYETVIPMCTPLQLLAARGRKIVFEANGQRYNYIVHRSSRVDLQTHLNRTFSTNPCPNVAALGQADQTGVQSAQPVVGMSRQGVLLALGYPPDHRTPALANPVWTYWGTRGNVMVNFTGEVVSSITGESSEPAVMAGGGVAPPSSGQVVVDGGGGGVPINNHQPEELTIVVIDPNGYPTQVPQAAFNVACNPQTPCHPALVCTTGVCQAVSQ